MHDANRSSLRSTGLSSKSPTIAVFDSGVGGLTVYAEIIRARPDARFIYIADDASFPYGEIADAKLVARVTALMTHLIARENPDLVVIACNTASTIALPALRTAFAVPFVGTVPAIKPACAASRTRRVSVLGTRATVQREYTRALIERFALDCKVTLIGSARLAQLAQAAMCGQRVDDEAITAEIAPCFLGDGGDRTDTVVLACTHYPLLRARLETLAPWSVQFIDPAAAIARRVVQLIGAGTAAAAPARRGQALFTAGRPSSAALITALGGYGFGRIAGFDAE